MNQSLEMVLLYWFKITFLWQTK